MLKKKKTILFADENPNEAQQFSFFMQKHPEFEVFTCTSGEEVLNFLTKEAIDLFILDLFLPKLHGIELLKIIKAKDSDKGVIITSWEPMFQNYRAVVTQGADYFLDKPYTPDKLFSLIDRYFKGNLFPDDFESAIEKPSEGDACFLPRSTESNTYIKFWGTRGSSAVSGPEFSRFGGYTSCLEVRTAKQLIIIDAGTGIRSLGSQIVKENRLKEIHLFLGHTHLDHISGFPFFTPLYHKGYTVHVYGPAGFYKNTQELFSEMLTHTYFPVDLHEVQADVFFHEIHTLTPIQIGDITIDTHHTYHPGPTLGFKITLDKMTLGYVTDNEMLMGYDGDPILIGEEHPLLKPHLGLIDFLKDCDLLIHEAQYTPQLYGQKIGWGHSSITNATVLFKFLKTKLWIVTHHDPSDTDVFIQTKYQMHLDVLEHCKIQTQVRMAYDGLKIAL